MLDESKEVSAMKWNVKNTGVFRTRTGIYDKTF